MGESVISDIRSPHFHWCWCFQIFSTSDQIKRNMSWGGPICFFCHEPILTLRKSANQDGESNFRLDAIVITKLRNRNHDSSTGNWWTVVLIASVRGAVEALLIPIEFGYPLGDPTTGRKSFLNQAMPILDRSDSSDSSNWAGLSTSCFVKCLQHWFGTGPLILIRMELGKYHQPKSRRSQARLGSPQLMELCCG